MTPMKLSICIATLNRAAFIGETIESVASQMPDAVELVIVDGASTDNTAEVVRAFQNRFENIRYFQEVENSGVDADFDKAVHYANGEYCWLMTDDDLLVPGAIEQVVAALQDAPQLLVVNASLHSADFSIQFSDGMLPLAEDRRYRSGDSEQVFADLAAYMSFIGCIVIDRRFWMSRERKAYYGSLFIHVGVAFQSPPLRDVHVISQALIVIRYGNAMWTPRRFEIWMFMWPRLIWSFESISESMRARVSSRSPWRAPKNMLLYKAMGGYGPEQYGQFIRPLTSGWRRFSYYALAKVPASSVSLLAIVACIAVGGRNTAELYDIWLGPSTGPIGRWLARRFLSVST